MGLRERVQQAIAGPVGESERLLTICRPRTPRRSSRSSLAAGGADCRLRLRSLRSRSTTCRDDEPPKRQRRPHQAGKPKRRRRNRLNEPTWRTPTRLNWSTKQESRAKRQPTLGRKQNRPAAGSNR